MTVGANLSRRPSIGCVIPVAPTSVRGHGGFSGSLGLGSLAPNDVRGSRLIPVDGADVTADSGQVFSRSAHRDAAGASRCPPNCGKSPCTRRGPLRPVAWVAWSGSRVGWLLVGGARSWNENARGPARC